MFQLGSKFYLNAPNWKCYQDLNYNNRDIYRDIEEESEKSPLLSKLSCNLKGLNKLTKSKNSHKTGLRRTSSTYSIRSVKERLANEAGSNTGIDIYKFKQKMANTLSVMTNVLRNVVSKQRIRYKEKGFNLDLAYVCDNIIAMGYPAEKYESMYRNRLEDVYKFLEENHRDHYKIYNLCLERSYDISKFHGRVSVYPFEDHNPPTIEMILNFCEDVDNWLKADPLNVAAVHCKAGKGRTGTMICCYLLYSGQQRTAEDALACYDEKRTKDRKGVTIPSQRRYVQYFSKLMRLGLQYQRRTLQFCEIRFSEVHTLQSQGTVHCSISVLQEKVQQLQNFAIDFRKNCILDIKNPPLPVTGDIKVELTKNAKKIFHFWFNTFFVIGSAAVEGEGKDVKLVYTLHKWEIDDAHKDKEHKCFSEDFKVELVFYVDDADVDRDHIKVSSSNRLCSNHSSIIQNSTVRMSSQLQQQQQQSNNYSLPQNNSSGSEMNYICDQKSSSSASVSSSLGGGGTDTSNGYEFNRSTVQRNSVVQPFDNHHSNHFMAAATDVNKGVIFPTQTPVQHMPQQLNYIDQQLQNQHKNNIPQQHKQKQQLQQQQQPKTLTIMANQRHLQRQVAGGNDSSGSSIVGGGDVHANKLNNMDATCLPSTNLNATNCSNSSSSCNNSTNMTSISYNHNHSNSSSKTSSVSSESSSSTIGDNEEDWESGESQAKQLDHITLLLSTSSITNPTSALPLPSNNPTPPSKYLNTDNTTKSLRNCKTPKSDVQDSSSTSSSISTSNSSNHPSNNKSKTINSSCTFRVVGGDDDVDDDNNDDDRKLKHKKLNLNNVIKLAPTITDTNTKSVESKGGDNNIISNVPCEAGQTPIIPAQTSRPKLMHLLMAPKNLQQSTHKPIFKRKSSYKLVKGSNLNSGGSSMSTDGSNNLLASSAAITATGGVGTSSKQKLKIKLKKNKLKLSQKFHWFQSYFRADPVDFCENFVQQTTSMRRNSLCSMASRTHKLSTTTPPSVTPPPQTNAESSCERLDRAASAHSVSTSDASIATGDLCEDYYSSICDNQLSFSNSPCKSPRSMADMGSSISGVSGGMTHGSSFGSSFAKSSGSLNPYLRERRETLPGCSSHVNSRRNNVVVVAAKPAKIHAIGFNVNATNLARQDSFETNGEDDVDASPDSIYYTPSSALLPSTGNANDHTAFVFPQIRKESDLEAKAAAAEHGYIKTTNNSASMSKPQAKYSLNLVIVKECSEACLEKTTKPTVISESVSTESNNESDGTESDSCDCSHKVKGGDNNRLQNLTMLLEKSESEKILNSKTSASVCSNSSSSGFCTSECCTTNSSSSICNCNPFALDLERHVASAKQDSQHNAIQEIVEATNLDNNLCDTEEKANVITDLGTEVSSNPNDTELNANSTCDRQ